jgi:hypothetical protein
MTSPIRRSTMYNLGAFVRHLVKGFTQDIGPERRVVREEVREQVHEAEDGGRVTLRRTIIEEVEIDPRRTSGGGAGNMGGMGEMGKSGNEGVGGRTE